MGMARQQRIFNSLMASIPHLPLLSILSITFLSITNISANGNSVKSPCGSFDCGNGLTIGYPFWRRQNQLQAQFCGYPNLAISCTNNQPILKLSNNSYLIKHYNNNEKTLTIAYTDEANETSTCPIATHTFTLDNNEMFFNYTSTKDNKLVHFYYNCTVYPPSVPNIKCLQRGAKNSYAFVDGSVPEFDWAHYCESIVTVPVVIAANGLGDVLTQGFKLTWKSSAEHECHLCEANGGYCGYTSNSNTTSSHNFFCLCSHGKDFLNCHDHADDQVSVFRPNYVVTGTLMIFGGVLVVLALMYFIRKRKISVKKQGFSQIPSNYGK